MNTLRHQIYKFSTPLGLEYSQIARADPVLDRQLPKEPERILYIFYPFRAKKAYVIKDEVNTVRDLIMFAASKYAELYYDEEKFFLDNLSDEYCGKCRYFGALETTIAARNNDCANCIEEQKEQTPLACSHACSICQGVDSPKEQIILTGCSHEYHPSCLERWFVLRNSCPLCRAPLMPCTCQGARSKSAIFSDFILPNMSGPGPHGLYQAHMNELRFSALACAQNIYWLVLAY